MEHRVISKGEVEKVEAFIKDTIPVIKDEGFIEFANKSIEIAGRAKKAAADNNEKWTYLYSAITQWANKIVFHLFSEDLLTEELETKYRELEKMDVAGKLVQDYADERKAAEDELVGKMKPLHEARQGIGVFLGVLEGKELDEAKEQQAEYNQKVERAMMEQGA